MNEFQFLRPVLTQHIIDRLIKGQSLNLYGPPGVGKTRLLEDIAAANLVDVQVIIVSFKGYQNSYQGFCQAVWVAAEIGGKPAKSLSHLMNAFHKNEKIIFFLIDDFKYLHDNPDVDSDYSQQFIDGLNSVSNMARVSLMTVTEEPANNVLIYIKKRPVASSLNMTPLGITTLSEKEISLELERKGFSKFLDKKGQNRLVSHLLGTNCNYGFMEHLYPKLISEANSGLPLYDRLKVWEKSYKKERRAHAIKSVDKSTRKMKGWVIVLNPFRQVINQLQRMLKGPVSFVQNLLPQKDDN